MGRKKQPRGARARDNPTKGITAFMANTKALSKEDRKKAKRTVRKKKKTESPLKPREYARGSAKRKVKKLVRGTAKR
jgi:hypothetical protein